MKFIHSSHGLSTVAPFHAPAGEGSGFDPNRLKAYSITKVLEQRSIPLQHPETFFNEGAPLDPFRMFGTAEDAAMAQACLERGLATFDERERPALMLATIHQWTKGDEGILGFFIGPQSMHYDKVMETLGQLGLEVYAEVFRLGHALFGDNFGTLLERYERWSDGHGTILDKELDEELLVLSDAWLTLPPLIDIAAQLISWDGELAKRYEAHRQASTDDERIRFLADGIWRQLAGETDAESGNKRSHLPTPYADFLLLYELEMEMLNGSVEQYFFNAAGNLAPECAEALERTEMGEQAARLRQVMARFPEPYPAAIGPRRDFILAGDESLRRLFEEATAFFDDGSLRTGMIRMAKATGIMPV